MSRSISQSLLRGTIRFASTFAFSSNGQLDFLRPELIAHGYTECMLALRAYRHGYVVCLYVVPCTDGGCGASVLRGYCPSWRVHHVRDCASVRVRHRSHVRRPASRPEAQMASVVSCRVPPCVAGQIGAHGPVCGASALHSQHTWVSPRTPRVRRSATIQAGSRPR